jgi:phosphoserine phosphatase
MDGTLTTVMSPWRYIHERLGVWETRGVPIFGAFLAGHITYGEFCRLDLDLWMGRGVTLADVEQMLEEIPLNPHLGRLTDRLARKGIPIAIVSTGFTATAERIRQASDHDRWHVAANHLFEDDGGTLDIELNVADGEDHPRSKAEVFKGICERLGVKPSEVLALGDGPSDEQMFSLAGASVRLVGPDCLLQALEYVR